MIQKPAEVGNEHKKSGKVGSHCFFLYHRNQFRL